MDEAEAHEMSLEDELRAATGGGFIENRPPVSTDQDLVVGILSDDKVVKVLVPDVSLGDTLDEEDLPAEDEDVEMVDGGGPQMDGRGPRGDGGRTSSPLMNNSSHSTPSKTPRQGGRQGASGHKARKEKAVDGQLNK